MERLSYLHKSFDVTRERCNSKGSGGGNARVHREPGDGASSPCRIFPVDRRHRIDYHTCFFGQ